ncbi:50S ribosomal protein L3 [Chloroflexota bacterium]
MITGILGKKIGMTHIFGIHGGMVPVTAIEAGPCVITQIKTVSKDEYEAVQVGFGETTRLNKPQKGHLDKLGSFRHLRELVVEDISKVKVGQKVDVGLFDTGELVDISGISKGKGFAGGMKRHNFHGGPKTHGQSDRHRAPGSIGAGTSPGRVMKGQRMAGHMGNVNVTVRNLEVLESDQERNVLLVRGAVPGPDGGLLVICKAGKRKRGK